MSLSTALSGNNDTPLRIAISGFMGSTSLACWIVLLLPQLIEQWRLKSIEGISTGFISIWFLGDLFNLIGSIWARLLPEVIFLAVWFCFADVLMISSYVYYAHIFPKHHKVIAHRTEQRLSTDDTPLIAGTERRSSHKSRRSSILTDMITKPGKHSVFVKYIIPIVFVLAAGFVGYICSSPPDADGPDDGGSGEVVKLGPQALGYLSAILYLGARIPQIIQNYKRRSVHGLSLLFFLFSSFGNITYAAQILFYRNDWKYIALNFSWLLGSLGTIFEDAIIMLQFYLYQDTVLEDEEIEIIDEA